MDKKDICNICGNNGGFKLITIKNGYHIFKCPSCGVYFVHPQPSEEKLKKIYSFDEDYFKYTDFNEKILSVFLAERLKWLGMNDIKNKKFLDVGCGTGEAVFFAEKMGYDALGLEINDGTVERMKKRGINVINSTLENFNGRKNSFDVIYLGEIVEHVKDPSRFLDKCNFLLKKSGRLLVTTPNTNSFIAKYQLVLNRLFGIPWGHISPPHHLFEFSDKNLVGMLKSKKFKVEGIRFNTSSFSYSVGNTGLFKNFKKEYRKSRNFFKAWKKNGWGNNILLGTVVILFSAGYLFNKFLGIFCKGGNAMAVLAVKK